VKTLLLSGTCAFVLFSAQHVSGFEVPQEPVQEISAVEHMDARTADQSERRSGRENRRSGARERGSSMNPLSQEMMEKLNLSDAQEEQIRQLRSAYARDMVKLQADIKLARIELRETTNATNPSVTDVKAKAAQVAAAQGSLFERRVVFRAEMKNVLTQEQREALQEQVKESQKNRRNADRRHRGGRDHRSRR